MAIGQITRRTILSAIPGAIALAGWPLPASAGDNTQIGILYSIEQRLRREIIIPDDDRQLMNVVVRPGEKLIFQSTEDYAKRGPDAAVLDDSGGEPLSDRCAVIDADTKVVGHVLADPAIDALPGVALVQSDISIEGDSYLQQEAIFQRKYVVVDEKGIVTDVIVTDPAAPPVVADNAQVLTNLPFEVGDKVPDELLKDGGGAVPIEPTP